MRAVPDNVPFQCILFISSNCTCVYVHVFVISIFPMAINAFVALCTSLSSFLQNMRYSTICSSYNGHFQAILENTKKYKYSTICSLCNGHFQAILHCGHSHNSNHLGSYFLWTSLGFFTFFIPAIFSDHVFCGHCSLATFPEHVC